MSLDSIVELITQNGIIVVVLGWFMFRMEKRIEDLTNALKELVILGKGTTAKN